AKTIQGEVGQLSAAVIKDGPIWRFPSMKRLWTKMLVIGRCRCLRQRIDDFLELPCRAAGGEPVGDVTLIRAAVPMLADIENADPLSDAVEGRDHLLAMLAALGMIIGKHHDIGAAQILGIFGAPFLDAPGFVVAARPMARRLSTSFSPSGM